MVDYSNLMKQQAAKYTGADGVADPLRYDNAGNETIYSGLSTPMPTPYDYASSVHTPLMQDMGYSAYLRKMQFDESSIQSSLQAAQEAARRRIVGQAGQYDLQRTQSSDRIADNFENRGMFRSGQRLKDQSAARDQIDFGQRQFEDNTREGIAGMERGAAQSIAGLRRQRAEEELATRDRLTQGSIQ